MQFSHNLIVMANYFLTNENYKRRYQEFLQRLKAARVESGLTQQEVAEKLGKNQSFISRSEKGERRIDIVELQAFAKLYKKTINYFFEQSVKPNQ